jgi:hypothetical protein
MESLKTLAGCRGCLSEVSVSIGARRSRQPSGGEMSEASCVAFRAFEMSAANRARGLVHRCAQQGSATDRWSAGARVGTFKLSKSSRALTSGDGARWARLRFTTSRIVKWFSGFACFVFRVWCLVIGVLSTPFDGGHLGCSPFDARCRSTRFAYGSVFRVSCFASGG